MISTLYAQSCPILKSRPTTAALEEEARTSAMADARRRAESLANLAGVELGEIRAITEVIGQPAYPFPAIAGAAVMESAAPSISPGQLSHQVQVQVAFGIN